MATRSWVAMHSRAPQLSGQLARGSTVQSVASVVAPLAITGSYTLTNLGTRPGGDPGEPRGLNNLGHAVGAATETLPRVCYALWVMKVMNR
jgi:hypothetical protein